jgi:hypothetical protein
MRGEAINTPFDRKRASSEGCRESVELPDGVKGRSARLQRPAFADHLGPGVTCFNEFVHSRKVARQALLASGKTAAFSAFT